MKNKLYVAVAFLVGLALGISGAQLLRAGTSVADCGVPTPGTPGHSITIKDGSVTPQRLTAKRCDTLKIINTDTVTRELAFGQHDRHMPYDGIEERSLAQNESLVITLNQLGTFHFHDHLHEQTEGFFTVTK